MHPVLFDFGFLSVKTYGVCIAVGFLLCWKILEKLSGRKDLGDLLVWLMASGVIGARTAYVIEHWNTQFAASPLEIFRVDKGGLVFYGGLLASIAVFFAWCAAKKARRLELADLLCVVIPLGHACGRIGCFFYGCCWGRLSDSAFAVRFPAGSPAWHDQLSKGLIASSAPAALPVLPAQLFEAALLLPLFALLLAIWFKWRRGTAGAYLCGYAAIRFCTEFLRGDPRAGVFGLSIGQTISIFIFLAGVAFLCAAKKRTAQ